MEQSVHSFESGEDRSRVVPVLSELSSVAGKPTEGSAPSLNPQGVFGALLRGRNPDSEVHPEPSPGFYQAMRENGWRYSAGTSTHIEHVVRTVNGSQTLVQVMTLLGESGPSELIQVIQAGVAETWRCVAELEGESCTSLFVSGDTSLETVVENLRSVLERFNRAVSVVCDYGSRE